MRPVRGPAPRSTGGGSSGPGVLPSQEKKTAGMQQSGRRCAQLSSPLVADFGSSWPVLALPSRKKIRLFPKCLTFVRLFAKCFPFRMYVLRFELGIPPSEIALRDQTLDPPTGTTAHCVEISGKMVLDKQYEVPPISTTSLCAFQRVLLDLKNVFHNKKPRTSFKNSGSTRELNVLKMFSPRNTAAYSHTYEITLPPNSKSFSDRDRTPGRV